MELILQPRFFSAQSFHYKKIVALAQLQQVKFIIRKSCRKDLEPLVTLRKEAFESQ